MQNSPPEPFLIWIPGMGAHPPCTAITPSHLSSLWLCILCLSPPVIFVSLCIVCVRLRLDGAPKEYHEMYDPQQIKQKSPLRPVGLPNKVRSTLNYSFSHSLLLTVITTHTLSFMRNVTQTRCFSRNATVFHISHLHTVNHTPTHTDPIALPSPIITVPLMVFHTGVT